MPRQFVLTMIIMLPVLRGDEWTVLQKENLYLSESWDLGLCQNISRNDSDSARDMLGAYTLKLVSLSSSQIKVPDMPLAFKFL